MAMLELGELVAGFLAARFDVIREVVRRAAERGDAATHHDADEALDAVVAPL
jgi:hypothetical protein